MAIGYYNTPVQGNVANTYIPIPFEEIMKAGSMRQQAQDTYLANLAQQESVINSLAYAPGDEPIVKAAASSIDEIARNAARLDLSQGINRRSVQEQLRNKINLQQLATVARNKEAFDTRNKLETDLRIRGLYYDPYEKANDPYLNGTWRPGEAYNYTPKPMTDPDQVLAEYFTKIPQQEYSYTDPVTGETKNYEVKTKEQLLKVANEDAATLALNPSMQWAITQYRNSHPEAKSMSDVDIVRLRTTEAVNSGRFTYNRSKHAGWDPNARTKGTDNLGLGTAPTTIQEPYPDEPLDKSITRYNRAIGRINNITDAVKDKEAALKGMSSDNPQYAQLHAEINELQGQKSYLNNLIQQVGEQSGADDIRKADTDNIIASYNGKIKAEDILRAQKLLQESNFNTGVQVTGEAHSLKEATSNIGKGIEKLFGSEMSDIVETPVYKELASKYGRIKTSLLFDKLRDIEHTYNKSIKQNYNDNVNGIVPQASIRTGFLPPTYGTGSNRGQLLDYSTDKYVPSEVQRVVDYVRTDPENHKVISLDGQDKKLKKLKESKEVNLQTLAFLPDKDGWYSTINTLDDKGNQTKNSYKIYFNQSEMNAVAKDYYRQNDFQKAFVYSNPEIGNAFIGQENQADIRIPVTVYTQLDENGNPVQGEERIIHEGNTYKLANSDKPAMTKEQMAQYLYNLQYTNLATALASQGVSMQEYFRRVLR